MNKTYWHKCNNNINVCLCVSLLGWWRRVNAKIAANIPFWMMKRCFMGATMKTKQILISSTMSTMTHSDYGKKCAVHEFNTFKSHICRL